MPTLAEQAYEAIKTEIIRGKIDPDEPFTQAIMADRFEYGLAAIRSALLQLANEGFIRAIPRYGYMIVPITVSDIHEIYELRIALEPMAARLAAERAPEELVEKICEAAHHTYIYQDWESYSKFLTYNSTFHQTIALASGNQRLYQIVSKLLDDSNHIFYMALDISDTTQQTLEDHLTLANAIKQRNPDLAERLSREEALHSHENVLAAILGGRYGIVKTRNLIGV